MKYQLAYTTTYLCFVQVAAGVWWPFSNPSQPSASTSCEPSLLPINIAFESDSAVAQSDQEYFITYEAKSKQNECWNRAFLSINNACSNMHTQAQQELALRFTECFLRDSGRSIDPCISSRKAVSLCLHELDHASFAVYTEFFTHAESICHYIQADLWQRTTKATIQTLSKSAAQTAHTLIQTNGLQQTILENQQEQLQGFQTLREEHAKFETGLTQTSQELDRKFGALSQFAGDISKDLEAQTASLDQIMEFKQEYAAAHLQVLDQLQSASSYLGSYIHKVEQALLQAEETHVQMEHSIGYVERIITGVSNIWNTMCTTITYAIWVNIIYICTSTKATQSSRTGLLLLWLGSILAEAVYMMFPVTRYIPMLVQSTRYTAFILGGVWYLLQFAQSITRTPEEFIKEERSEYTSNEPNYQLLSTPYVNLYTMNRRKLQMMAKSKGIPANWSSNAIIEALLGKP